MPATRRRSPPVPWMKTAAPSLTRSTAASKPAEVSTPPSSGLLRAVSAGKAGLGLRPRRLGGDARRVVERAPAAGGRVAGRRLQPCDHAVVVLRHAGQRV